MVSYFHLATTADARTCIRTEYSQSFTEQVGQLILSTARLVTVAELMVLTRAAKFAGNLILHPKIVNIALTILAVAAIAFAFHAILPTTAVLLAQVKMIALAQVSTAAAGASIRAIGRFTNHQLMSLFYLQCGHPLANLRWNESYLKLKEQIDIK